jgi:hypothetical protein
MSMCVNRIHLTQNRDQWRADVNTVMNIRFHKGREFLDWVTIGFSRTPLHRVKF